MFAQREAFVVACRIHAASRLALNPRPVAFFAHVQAKQTARDLFGLLSFQSGPVWIATGVLHSGDAPLPIDRHSTCAS